MEDVNSMCKCEEIKRELDELPNEKWSESFRDYWESSIGSTLYGMFVNEYSKKMWDIKNNNEIVLDYFDLRKKSKKLSLGSPTTSADYYGAYPVNYDAYNPYFDLCADGVDVRFNTIADAYDIPNKKVMINGEWMSADVIINTVSPDELFEHHYGELKYMGREFTKIILPIKRITPPDTHFIHFASDEPYTRIVEYKVFTGYESADTLIVIEYPSHKNKLYPYPVKTEIDKYQKYITLLPDGVFSIGRMGRYKYEDMARIVLDMHHITNEL
jgi:UDP-galactopyranose mutase